jgi:metal-responsive CopG/Arc/MetJ family transcriptional regulator
MRTIVDIPDEQLRRLDAEARRLRISRAESVRRAIAAYLDDEERKMQAFKDAFGAWKHKDMPDSVEWVEKLREEWER